jgi:PKD repeat protein
MECVIDYTNENIVYGCIQYGSFYKSTDGGNNSVSIQQPGGGDWVTPYVIDPIDPNTLYVGNNYVRKTTNGMGSWTTIGNFGSGNINALAVAKSDPNYIYAAKDELIWRTTDGGNNWTEISAGLPGYFITYIDVHPSNPQKIAVTLSNFWVYAAGEKVYISNDAGSNWINHSGSLPNLPVNCVVWQDGPYEALYVGMDVGVYYRDNTLSDWISYTGNLPNVMIDELEIDENIQKVRAATFGRGLWEVDVYRATPMAPVADFTADNTTINQGGTVNFTDLSSNSPTSWSWTFDGGTPGTSALQNPQVTYNSPGNYTVSLTATNASGSDTETKTDYITVLGQLPTYCSSSGATFDKEWISDVAIDSFSNSSGAAGYSDFTGLIIQLTAGANASITLTPGKAPGKPQTEYWKVWIDVNADGDFDDAGEEVFSASGKNAVTGSFTVPSSVVYTGLRVSMKRDSYPTPCETFAYGEVEDYAVNINAAGAASVAAAKNSSFTVSMNPANSQLFISHPKYKGSLLINIYNSKGSLARRIMHNGGKTKQVNIADLPAGTYSMILHDGKSKVERYFVKK